MQTLLYVTCSTPISSVSAMWTPVAKTVVDHAVDGVSLETAATHNFQIPDVVLSLQESL